MYHMKFKECESIDRSKKMAACQRCESPRILHVSAHGRDCNYFRINEFDYDGYVPPDLGVGNGDDVEFSVCLNCGQMQGSFPREKTQLENGIAVYKI
jgi:hypothetical protein